MATDFLRGHFDFGAEPPRLGCQRFPGSLRESDSGQQFWVAVSAIPEDFPRGIPRSPGTWPVPAAWLFPRVIPKENAGSQARDRLLARPNRAEYRTLGHRGIPNSVLPDPVSPSEKLTSSCP